MSGGTKHRAAAVVGWLEGRGAGVTAVLAGGASALAFPPFGLLIGLLGYGALMRLFDAAAPARPLLSAFWRGWLAGTAFFLVSTWWVGEAFFIDAAAHGWQAPFAVGLLAMGLGLFWGLAGAVYRALSPAGAARVLAFAGVFCAVEWLRGHVLTGFPWDLAGESWRAGSPVSQFASLAGAYGLSWITVAIGAAPAPLVDTAIFTGGRGRWSRLAAVAVGGLALAGAYAFGAERLARAKPTPADAPRVRLAQADEAEQLGYTPAQIARIVERYASLTARPAARPPDIVVWPEGAIPMAMDDYLAEGTWTRQTIAGALRPGQTLMIGAWRVVRSPDNPIYFNTLVAVRKEGGDLRLTGLYDKYRLVPFGEYLPLARLLKPLGVDKLVGTGAGDGFTPGPPPAPISPEGAPRVQPLICYEGLFPGLIHRGAGTGGRAAWIVNVSDDAWFGSTYGPSQHLNLASYRAIEEGLPIARVTPTGISAVIDAYGRIPPGARLDHGALGVIDAPLPPALAPTLYARVGDAIFAALLCVSILGALFGRLNRRLRT